MDTNFFNTQYFVLPSILHKMGTGDLDTSSIVQRGRKCKIDAV